MNNFLQIDKWFSIYLSKLISPVITVGISRQDQNIKYHDIKHVAVWLWKMYHCSKRELS